MTQAARVVKASRITPKRSYRTRIRRNPLGAMRDAEAKIADRAVLLLAEALADTEEMKNQRVGPAYWAAGTLIGFKAAGKPAFKALAKAASRPESLTTGMSCEALGLLAKAEPTVTDDVVNVFRKILQEKDHDRVSRWCAVKGLTEMGRAAKAAVPDFVAILGERDLSDHERDGIYRVLYSLRVDAAKAVPVLVTRLEAAKDSSEQLQLLRIFEVIGPPAEAAVKPIEKWSEGVRDPEVQDQVITTLGRIK